MSSPPLPRPEPVSAAASQGLRGYARRYLLRGAAGQVALQRVETEVRLLRDGVAVVSYRGCYWEFFRFAADEPREDLHDLDVQRDGWSTGRLRRLLTRHGLRDPGGDGRLEASKRFLLLPGRVEGEAPLHVSPAGGSFGFLAEVDGEEPVASLLLGRGEDLILPTQPLPSSSGDEPPQGRGSVLGGPGWQARERFALRFATQTLEVQDGGGYAAVETGGVGR